MDGTLNESARKLGETLRRTSQVISYLEAKKAVEADPTLVAREKHILVVYQELASRQRAGEELSKEEVQNFYDLRNEVQQHPLIQTRDRALGSLKSLFLQAGSEISNQLGVNFSYLALAPSIEEEEPEE